MSKEHIWAKSLTKLFDDEEVGSGEHIIRHDYANPEAGVPPRLLKRAKTFALITRKVCRDCNGGWMREADEAALPLLEAFAKNRPVSLGPAEQVVVAFWATKILLAILSQEPEDYRFAPPERYQELYASRAPLKGCQVWLGANDHGEVAWARAHSLRLEDGAEVSDGFGASLSFGYAVVHIIWHGREPHHLRLRYDAARALKQIWPPQEEVRWPPGLLVADFDLTALAHLIHANSVWVAGEEDGG